MKNTDNSLKIDNITLSRKDLEKIKSDMFDAGYLAGAQKLDITEKDLVEISLNLTQAAKIVEKTNPKLADWLKFVNRKAITLVNNENHDKTDR